jgi:hypothetical protein
MTYYPHISQPGHYLSKLRVLRVSTDHHIDFIPIDNILQLRQCIPIIYLSIPRDKNFLVIRFVIIFGRKGDKAITSVIKTGKVSSQIVINPLSTTTARISLIGQEKKNVHIRIIFLK